jgi:two-component system, OmpR family, sensor kinase
MVARRAELTESPTRMAVAEARRMAAEEIVTVVAHDLGNALTPVKGRLDIVRHRIARENPDGNLEDVDIAIHSLERVQRMVGELLDVARIDEGISALSTQTVDLVPLVQEIVAEFRSVHEDIKLQIPTELRVHADPDRITQVLENLLANAVKHGEEQVPITVGAGLEQNGDGCWAEIRVQAAGPGIPREQLAEIFTRFAAGPQSTGLGIGLYLAQRIAQEHGGTLTVDSANGSGTNFRLSLPLAPDGSASSN